LNTDTDTGGKMREKKSPIGHSSHCVCDICSCLKYDDEGEPLLDSESPDYCPICKLWVKGLVEGVKFDVCPKCLKELQNDNS